MNLYLVRQQQNPLDVLLKHGPTTIYWLSPHKKVAHGCSKKTPPPVNEKIFARATPFRPGTHLTPPPGIATGPQPAIHATSRGPKSRAGFHPASGGFLGAEVLEGGGGVFHIEPTKGSVQKKHGKCQERGRGGGGSRWLFLAGVSPPKDGTQQRHSKGTQFHSCWW